MVDTYVEDSVEDPLLAVSIHLCLAICQIFMVLDGRMEPI